MNQNRKAFLDMLAVSEGTKDKGDDGYNVIFGGGLFESYADHPRKFITYTSHDGVEHTTSAAGRYQILAKYWDAYNRRHQWPSFEPKYQDEYAMIQLQERMALHLIDAGKVDAAIKKVACIWASLPGAGYGQPEQKLEMLRKAFTDNGGVIT